MDTFKYIYECAHTHPCTCRHWWPCELIVLEEKLLSTLSFSSHVLNSWKGAALRDGGGEDQRSGRIIWKEANLFLKLTDGQGQITQWY